MRTKRDRNPTTIKLYDGASELDGARIVAILTGLVRPSTNSKTGEMLQTWILRYDRKPNQAVKDGTDASVCGQCPLRPYLAAMRDRALLPRPCYVKTYQAPRRVWETSRDLPVTGAEQARALIAGRQVRQGSYGDPAAVPAHVWQGIEQAKPDVRAMRAAGVPAWMIARIGKAGSGYTHQWEKGYRPGLMASVHTQAERIAAKALGFRTFRVVGSVDSLEQGEILCPASKEAGNRTTCLQCGLCDGGRGSEDRRKDIAIVAH